MKSWFHYYGTVPDAIQETEDSFVQVKPGDDFGIVVSNLNSRRLGDLQSRGLIRPAPDPSLINSAPSLGSTKASSVEERPAEAAHPPAEPTEPAGEADIEREEVARPSPEPVKDQKTPRRRARRSK